MKFLFENSVAQFGFGQSQQYTDKTLSLNSTANSLMPLIVIMFFALLNPSIALGGDALDRRILKQEIDEVRTAGEVAKMHYGILLSIMFGGFNAKAVCWH